MVASGSYPYMCLFSFRKPFLWLVSSDVITSAEIFLTAGCLQCQIRFISWPGVFCDEASTLVIAQVNDMYLTSLQLRFYRYEHVMHFAQCSLSSHHKCITASTIASPVHILKKFVSSCGIVEPTPLVLYFCLILAGIWHWKLQSHDGCHRGRQY